MPPNRRTPTITAGVLNDRGEHERREVRTVTVPKHQREGHGEGGEGRVLHSANPKSTNVYTFDDVPVGMSNWPVPTTFPAFPATFVTRESIVRDDGLR